MKILHFAFPFSMFVRGGIPIAHASRTHLQYIISSFSSFAIHFLVNSVGKSLKFGLQTKNICKNCHSIFSKLEKTTELRRGIQPMEVFPMFISSLLWHCSKNIVLCGHSTGSLRALPDTENKSPAPPARP